MEHPGHPDVVRRSEAARSPCPGCRRAGRRACRRACTGDRLRPGRRRLRRSTLDAPRRRDRTLNSLSPISCAVGDGLAAAGDDALVDRQARDRATPSCVAARPSSAVFAAAAARADLLAAGLDRRWLPTVAPWFGDDVRVDVVTGLIWRGPCRAPRPRSSARRSSCPGRARPCRACSVAVLSAWIVSHESIALGSNGAVATRTDRLGGLARLRRRRGAEQREPDDHRAAALEERRARELLL